MQNKQNKARRLTSGVLRDPGLAWDIGSGRPDAAAARVVNLLVTK
jgi:hypothetical protein